MNPILLRLMARRHVRRVNCPECLDTGIKIVVWKEAMCPQFRKVRCSCPAGQGKKKDV